jgi:hypothetical protein
MNEKNQFLTKVQTAVLQRIRHSYEYSVLYRVVQSRLIHFIVRTYLAVKKKLSLALRYSLLGVQ